MTVPVPDQLEFISDADGALKDFPYPRRFLQADEVVVTLRDADGLEIPQYLNQHYSIAGSSWPNGGVVSFYNAPAAGLKVVRTRMTQAKQTVLLNNLTRNDAPSVELQLDRLAMGNQDTRAVADRSLKFPAGMGGNVIRPVPLPERGKALVGNLDGSGYINAPVGEGDIAVAVIEATEARDEAVDAKNTAVQSDASAGASASTATNAATVAVDAKNASVAAATSLHNYDTLAQANANLANIPDDAGVNVLADGVNNGFYVKQGGVLVKKSDATLPKLQVSQEAISKSLADEAEDRKGLIFRYQNVVTVNEATDIFDDYVPGSDRVFVAADNTIVASMNSDKTFSGASGIVRRHQAGLRADIVMLPGIGQSWKGGTGGAPSLTLTADPNILMFVGGVRPKDTLAAPDCYASLVPAVESNNAGNVRGETPMSSFARGFAQALAEEDGIYLAETGTQFLISVVAPGATRLSPFTWGAQYYQEVMEQVQAGYARAQELGKTFMVGCIPVMLGKGDYDVGEVDRAAFAAVMKRQIIDINRDVKALIPDHPDIPFLLYHTGSHGHDGRQPNVDLAINDLDRDENIPAIFAGTLFSYTRESSTAAVHFINSAIMQQGAVGGVLAKRYVMTGEKPKVMLPVEYVAQGRVISIRFNPPKLPVVVDDVAMNNPTNSGFELFDGAGNPLTISSVSAAYDRVVITASAALPANWKLHYAFSGAYAPNVISGPRGSIRDSQGMVFDPTGINATLRNWSGIFEFSR